MSTEELIEQSIRRLDRLDQAVFGVFGEGGLYRELSGMRADFQKWREAEEKRREEEQNRRIADIRTNVQTFAASTLSLLAVVAAFLALVVK